MLRRILNRIRPLKMTMRMKFSLALGAIAAILLLSSVISILEYRRMSNYVSDKIAANISSINTAQRLADACDEYNLSILAAIGDTDLKHLPSFDESAFRSDYDSLRSSFSTEEALAFADSAVYSYSAYMLTSLELEEVMMSDFIDSRDWYFGRLQPKYQRFRNDIERLNELIYMDLKANSSTFQASFYRSIMPGIVSVGVGLLLVLLLLFFINVYYVGPLYRMMDGIENYRRYSRRYGYVFDGDDELVALNGGISEIIEENYELKKRISRLREDRDRLIESAGEK